MSHTNSPEELGPIEDLHSACVIDEDGNEVPITQEMIDAATDEIDQTT